MWLNINGIVKVKTDFLKKTKILFYKKISKENNYEPKNA